MRGSPLFNRSRLKLAAWYAGVMGIILGACSIAVYIHLAQSHWQAIDQEIESISGTLHDSLEPVLEQPGQVAYRVKQVVPGVCLSPVPCESPSTPYHVHVLGVGTQENRYVRFLNLSNQIQATVGRQPQSSVQLSSTSWVTFIDNRGERFHQFSLLLKTAKGQPWGYLQVGRSVEDYYEHLNSLKTFFLLGLPIVMILVGGASWWLAGLAMRPVYNSYQRIQQFTADAAHELRTPLAAIQATIESSLDGQNLDPEARITLETIERQNSRLAGLVKDLLLLSRMDLNVLPLKKQLCCLNDIISDLVEELAAFALSSQITLQATVLTDQRLYVVGDEEQLYRLVTNLIMNAIQYTPSDGQVCVVLLKKDQEGIIQVRDTGIGIASEDQQRIFDRFYRVSSDRSRKTGGSGLGLAIAQAIVQQHQGSIQVQSVVGHGSVFAVRLPLKNSR